MVPSVFGVDFRKLNNITIKNAYPLPLIEDILSNLGKAKVFSVLDLKSGYWQNKMTKESRPKTAFVSHKGLYEFNAMPFGLCSAPDVFQELMDQVLGDIKGVYAIAYLDDVIIWSDNANSHLAHLEEVFKRL